MRIAMVYPHGVPPVWGGAERLWQGIVDELNSRTEHVAELIPVESPESSFDDVVRSYARFDALDLDHFDMVITGKYPAWMVRHSRHVVYMAHPLRGLYDTYVGAPSPDRSALSRHGAAVLDLCDALRPGRSGAREQVLAAALNAADQLPPEHPDRAFPGPLIRRIVHWLDRDALLPPRTVRHLAISRTVASRPGYFPESIPVNVVIPPSSLRTLPPGDAAGRHFFTASRLDAPKRLPMLVEAMRSVTGNCELRIAGTGPQADALRALAADDPRVRFLGHIDDAQLADEYSSALAVPFIPLDEDLGLITLEAMASGRPVITCSDSGGPTELVTDGVSGFVVPPTVGALTSAMQRLVDDPGSAVSMGRRGAGEAALVTWAAVVDAVLSEPPPVQDRRRVRPVVLALSTYPAHPARHGGQVRLDRLMRSLARRVDVELVAIGPENTGPREIAPGFRQTTCAPSTEYYDLDHALTEAAGVPAGDIAATLAFEHLGDFGDIAVAAARESDAVILAHPYLYPLVRGLGIGHLVYDAHNAEFELKRAMYATNPAALATAEAVREVEAAVVRAADLVTSVSEDDIAALRSIGPTLAMFQFIPNGGDVFGKDVVAGAERRARRARLLRSLEAAGIGTGATSVALFVGSGHPPNVQAAHRILEIAPELPATLFVLAGSHVEHLGGVPTATNVLARGEVGAAEFTRLLTCCDVALNPMSAGSGTNIKMLDYFAAGAPTVSTLTGARGLDAEAGVHYELTDVEDLAAAIQRLLHRPDAADAMGTAARALAERFDWGQIGVRFTDVVVRTLSLL